LKYQVKTVLKGHDFSRAEIAEEMMWALRAAEKLSFRKALDLFVTRARASAGPQTLQNRASGFSPRAMSPALSNPLAPFSAICIAPEGILTIPNDITSSNRDMLICIRIP
jgi:hypothetical protein